MHLHPHPVTALRSPSRCAVHDKDCNYAQNVDLDISGLPCVGSSTMGAMRGQDDQSSQAQFFVHALLHLGMLTLQ